MFWIIFDTSTKRDYYRDVHNLLALPPGGTIRYDYNKVHLTDGAIERAKETTNKRPSEVLLVYAQDRNFSKGGRDYIGPLSQADAFWIGTRLGLLRHLFDHVDRYYFDLEVTGYPSSDRDALSRILTPLISDSEVPFNKWVGISEANQDLAKLKVGGFAHNWSALVDTIGMAPSQFSGDSFWRIARILSGGNSAQVVPALEQRTMERDGQRVVTEVYGVYPVQELSSITVEVESRTPGPGAEPIESEPPTPRTISFIASSDSSLAGLNGRTVVLRRYATDRIDGEVGATDRIKDVDVDLRLATGPDSGAFPTGPELTLHFRISKQPGRSYAALVLAVISAIFLVVGASIVKDYLEWGVVLIVLSVLGGVSARYLWTGSIKLPGSQK
jgi:hypothetical protein